MSALLAACGGDDDDDEGQAPTEPATDDAESSAPEVEASTPESDSAGGQAVVGSLVEPPTLLSGDPQSSAVVQQFLSMIANGLTKLRHPDMQVEPDLAESWEVSDDATVYTFTLHDGVLWQDGQPFTVEDVTFTYNAVAHPDWPGALDPYIAVIDGAPAYKEGEVSEISGITILDDDRVQFEFAETDVLFLAAAASRQRILPRHILSDVPPADIPIGDFTRKPTYTGLFMVEDWLPGESIAMRAFPDHFAGRPGLDTLVARFIPDPATAIAELRAGGLQVDFVSNDQFGSFVDDSGFQTQELAGAAGRRLQFDLTNPLFSDPRVRIAMSHAIDRDAIIDALFGGRAEPHFSLASPLSWIYGPDIPQFTFDPDRAATLLDEAGWMLDSDGTRVKDGQRFEFTMIAQPNVVEEALAIQPFLEDVGVRYQIEEQGAGQATGPLEVGDYDATITSWFNFIIDPRLDLQRNFESPRPVDSTGYNNDRVNELFDQARSEPDRERMEELYHELLVTAEEDAVHVYLWRINDLLVINNSLSVPDVQTQTELYVRIAEWSSSA